MKTPIAGYPIVVGSKRQVVVLVSGPDDYLQGTPPTLTARECGLKFIDHVAPAGASGATPTIAVPYFENEQRPPAFGGQTEVLVRWYETDGMSEVADHEDLSGAVARFIVLGE